MPTQKEYLEMVRTYLSTTVKGKRLAKQLNKKYGFTIHNDTTVLAGQTFNIKNAKYSFTREQMLFYMDKFIEILMREIHRILPYLSEEAIIDKNKTFRTITEKSSGNPVGRIVGMKFILPALHRDSLYYYTTGGKKVYTKDRRGKTGIDDILSLFIKGYTFERPGLSFRGFWQKTPTSRVFVRAKTHRPGHDVVRAAMNKFKDIYGFDIFLFDPAYTVRDGRVDTMTDVHKAVSKLNKYRERSE